MKIISLLVLSLFLLSACTDKQELDKANEKIAELQSQLELEKSKNNTSANPVNPVTEVAPTTTPEAKQEPETVASGTQWEYSQNEDKMSGGTTYHARVSSSNAVEFDFPYSGTQNATLALRIDPKYGKDLIFRIEKGQILCNSYEDCSVLVRFDDEKATNYSAIGAADNSTETIFIRNYGKFVEKMLKAKLVRISTNIYQQGAPVFEFNVSYFDQNKYKPKN
jgi:hypothetical protein